MAKRKLRTVKYAGETALLGICEYCNKTFESSGGGVGPEGKADIEKQFDAHTCKREDASQAAARIVRESRTLTD
jgi:hypothetical protein